MNHKNSARLIVSVLLFFLAALGVPHAMADNAVPSQSTASPSAMTTVLPTKEAEALFKFYFSGDAVFGKQDRHHRHKVTYWTPTAADVAQAETSLATCSYAGFDFNNPAKTRTIDLTKYCRQYAGVMRGEQKCLLINAFAASLSSSFVTVPSSNKPGGDWRDRAILVFDGGFAFFRTSYNPATHQVAPLEFGGF